MNDVVMSTQEEKAQPMDTANSHGQPYATLAEVPRFVSKDLFSKGNEIRIDHNGSTYTLRITRSGGLILNK